MSGDRILKFVIADEESVDDSEIYYVTLQNIKSPNSANIVEISWEYSEDIKAIFLLDFTANLFSIEIGHQDAYLYLSPLDGPLFQELHDILAPVALDAYNIGSEFFE